MNPTVAVIAQGAMGAGIGGRLVQRGLKVVTSLAGRSHASVERAAAAGMNAVSDLECIESDIFLSILPPSEALPLAERMTALISVSDHKPVYADCNAVSPQTKIAIGKSSRKPDPRSLMWASLACLLHRIQTGRPCSFQVPTPQRLPCSAISV